MVRHWPTPAINWPPLIAGPSGATAAPEGRVQGPGPWPAAKLLLDVESGKIAVSKATVPSNFKRFIMVSILRDAPDLQDAWLGNPCRHWSFPGPFQVCESQQNSQPGAASLGRRPAVEQRSAVIRKQLDGVVEAAHRIFADAFEIEVAFDEVGERAGQQHLSAQLFGEGFEP